MMGYETADGQNGGLKPVQASNPPLYLCASIGPADSAKEPAPHFPLRCVSVWGGKSLAQ